jgi:DNA-binding transcriptional LysR family regulator
VLNHAPSSKLRPKAPRRSGKPIENSRVSKFTTKAPITLISLGEGYTLLPDYAESLVFRNVTTRRLTPPAVEADLLMAWRKGDPSSENAALRDLITSKRRR